MMPTLFAQRALRRHADAMHADAAAAIAAATLITLMPLMPRSMLMPCQRADYAAELRY